MKGEKEEKEENTFFNWADVHLDNFLEVVNFFSEHFCIVHCIYYGKKFSHSLKNLEENNYFESRRYFDFFFSFFTSWKNFPQPLTLGDYNFNFNSNFNVVERRKINIFVGKWNIYLYIKSPCCFLYGLRLILRLIGKNFIQIVSGIILEIR